MDTLFKYIQLGFIVLVASFFLVGCPLMLSKGKEVGEAREQACRENKLNEKDLILSWSENAPFLTNNSQEKFTYEQFERGFCRKGHCSNIRPIEVGQINPGEKIKLKSYYKECRDYASRRGIYLYKDTKVPVALINAQELDLEHFN